MASSVQIMGILNVTPDSFYDGGSCYRGGKPDLNLIIDKVGGMINDGAHIIDVGGESSRPGADEVSVDEELARVVPVIKEIHQQFPATPISIDTRKPMVAEAALQAGASMVNDIAGFTSPSMCEVVAKSDCQLVLMHMQGEPQSMQKNPQYNNVIDEINAFFATQIAKLKTCGVEKSRIILDPGICFGKTLEHNLLILAHLEKFHLHGCPLLLGTSRKSFIGKIMDDMQVDRLPGSLATLALAQQQGVRYFRVHDVKASAQALKVAQAIAAFKHD